METKPYRIQSPEDIAKDYGGNKQKIAQAMQMGVVDPTAGVLAGMFIDRMRSAQVQEGAQAPTVAQQVFAPPAPMGGMGPPPGAPPMGAPPMGDMPPGAPPMGGMPPAPPMGGMGMPPAPPMGAPPMGDMPMGGMPPGAPPMGMADGGLAMLPIPETMFDEPNNGGYADGGVVAFAQGDEVDYDEILRKDMAYYRDPQNFMRDYAALYQPKRESAERVNQFNKDLLSEEGQKKFKEQSLNSFLMSFGAKLASKRGPLLSAAGEAAGETLPGYQESVKERRAEVRDALKQLAADENMTNAEQRAFVIEGMKGRGQAGEIAKGFADRAAAKELAQMEQAGALQRTNATVQGNIRAAEIGANATASTNPLKMIVDIQQTAQAEAQKAVEAWRKSQPTYGPTAKTLDARANQLYNVEYQKRIAAFAQSSPMLATMLGVAPGTGGGGYGPPPKDAVQRIS